jgi:hypothetical protein
MIAEYIDQVIMLISADWFTPHWETFYLIVEPKNYDVVKLEARDEVNRILGDCGIYWNVSFADERLNCSRQALERIFSICTRGGVLFDMIFGVDDLGQKFDSENDLPMIFQLNGILSNNTENKYNKSGLSPKIREIVSQIWSNSDIEYTDYDAIAANSTTDWDSRLRAMTPDLPTYLGDFLAAKVGVRLRVFGFLEKLRKALTPADILLLERWYEAAAFELTGARVSLSIN